MPVADQRKNHGIPKLLKDSFGAAYLDYFQELQTDSPFTSAFVTAFTNRAIFAFYQTCASGRDKVALFLSNHCMRFNLMNVSDGNDNTLKCNYYFESLAWLYFLKNLLTKYDADDDDELNIALFILNHNAKKTRTKPNHDMKSYKEQKESISRILNDQIAEVKSNIDKDNCTAQLELKSDGILKSLRSALEMKGIPTFDKIEQRSVQYQVVSQIENASVQIEAPPKLIRKPHPLKLTNVMKSPESIWQTTQINDQAQFGTAIKVGFESNSGLLRDTRKMITLHKKSNQRYVFPSRTHWGTANKYMEMESMLMVLTSPLVPYPKLGSTKKAEYPSETYASLNQKKVKLNRQLTSLQASVNGLVGTRLEDAKQEIAKLQGLITDMDAYITSFFDGTGNQINSNRSLQLRNRPMHFSQFRIDRNQPVFSIAPKQANLFSATANIARFGAPKNQKEIGTGTIKYAPVTYPIPTQGQIDAVVPITAGKRTIGPNVFTCLVSMNSPENTNANTEILRMAFMMGGLIGDKLAQLRTESFAAHNMSGHFDVFGFNCSPADFEKLKKEEYMYKTLSCVVILSSIFMIRYWVEKLTYTDATKRFPEMTGSSSWSSLIATVGISHMSELDDELLGGYPQLAHFLGRCEINNGRTDQLPWKDDFVQICTNNIQNSIDYIEAIESRKAAFGEHREGESLILDALHVAFVRIASFVLSSHGQYPSDYVTHSHAMHVLSKNRVDVKNGKQNLLHEAFPFIYHKIDHDLQNRVTQVYAANYITDIPPNYDTIPYHWHHITRDMQDMDVTDSVVWWTRLSETVDRKTNSVLSKCKHEFPKDFERKLYLLKSNVLNTESIAIGGKLNTPPPAVNADFPQAMLDSFVTMKDVNSLPVGLNLTQFITRFDLTSILYSQVSQYTDTVWKADGSSQNIPLDFQHEDLLIPMDQKCVVAILTAAVFMKLIDPFLSSQALLPSYDQKNLLEESPKKPSGTLTFEEFKERGGQLKGNLQLIIGPAIDNDLGVLHEVPEYTQEIPDLTRALSRGSAGPVLDRAYLRARERAKHISPRKVTKRLNYNEALYDAYDSLHNLKDATKTNFPLLIARIETRIRTLQAKVRTADEDAELIESQSQLSIVKKQQKGINERSRTQKSDQTEEYFLFTQYDLKDTNGSKVSRYYALGQPEQNNRIASVMAAMAAVPFHFRLEIPENPSNSNRLYAYYVERSAGFKEKEDIFGERASISVEDALSVIDIYSAFRFNEVTNQEAKPIYKNFLMKCQEGDPLETCDIWSYLQQISDHTVSDGTDVERHRPDWEFFISVVFKPYFKMKRQQLRHNASRPYLAVNVDVKTGEYPYRCRSFVRLILDKEFIDSLSAKSFIADNINVLAMIPNFTHLFRPVHLDVYKIKDSNYYHSVPKRITTANEFNLDEFIYVDDLFKEVWTSHTLHPLVALWMASQSKDKRYEDSTEAKRRLSESEIQLIKTTREFENSYDENTDVLPYEKAKQDELTHVDLRPYLLNSTRYDYTVDSGRQFQVWSKYVLRAIMPDDNGAIRQIAFFEFPWNGVALFGVQAFYDESLLYWQSGQLYTDRNVYRNQNEPYVKGSEVHPNYAGLFAQLMLHTAKSLGCLHKNLGTSDTITAALARHLYTARHTRDTFVTDPSTAEEYYTNMAYIIKNAGSILGAVASELLEDVDIDYNEFGTKSTDVRATRTNLFDTDRKVRLPAMERVAKAYTTRMMVLMYPAFKSTIVPILDDELADLVNTFQTRTGFTYKNKQNYSDDYDALRFTCISLLEWLYSLHIQTFLHVGKTTTRKTLTLTNEAFAIFQATRDLLAQPPRLLAPYDRKGHETAGNGRLWKHLMDYALVNVNVNVNSAERVHKYTLKAPEEPDGGKIDVPLDPVVRIDGNGQNFWHVDGFIHLLTPASFVREHKNREPSPIEFHINPGGYAAGGSLPDGLAVKFTHHLAAYLRPITIVWTSDKTDGSSYDVLGPADRDLSLPARMHVILNRRFQDSYITGIRSLAKALGTHGTGTQAWSRVIQPDLRAWDDGCVSHKCPMEAQHDKLRDFLKESACNGYHAGFHILSLIQENENSRSRAGSPLCSRYKFKFEIDKSTLETRSVSGSKIKVTVTGVIPPGTGEVWRNEFYYHGNFPMPAEDGKTYTARNEAGWNEIADGTVRFRVREGDTNTSPQFWMKFRGEHVDSIFGQMTNTSSGSKPLISTQFLKEFTESNEIDRQCHLGAMLAMIYRLVTHPPKRQFNDHDDLSMFIPKTDDVEQERRYRQVCLDIAREFIGSNHLSQKSALAYVAAVYHTNDFSGAIGIAREVLMQECMVRTSCSDSDILVESVRRSFLSNHISKAVDLISNFFVDQTPYTSHLPANGAFLHGVETVKLVINQGSGPFNTYVIYTTRINEESMQSNLVVDKQNYGPFVYDSAKPEQLKRAKEVNGERLLHTSIVHLDTVSELQVIFTQQQRYESNTNIDWHAGTTHCHMLNADKDSIEIVAEMVMSSLGSSHVLGKVLSLKVNGNYLKYAKKNVYDDKKCEEVYFRARLMAKPEPPDQARSNQMSWVVAPGHEKRTSMNIIKQHEDTSIYETIVEKFEHISI